jgi:hypothetical protein
VRGPLLAILARRYAGRLPLLRVPADRPSAIRERRVATGKALGVSALASGFARAAERCGLPVNDGFAGVSDFDL